jgi:predicted nucleic acid-binding protein
MVGIDADFLTLLLHPSPRVPMDPSTGKPVDRAKERVRHFIETLGKTREKIVIPTPALSEVLALAVDRASEYLAELTNFYGLEIAPFDQVAAVEAAIATADAKRRGSKKGGSAGSWAKVKFDRQIVAICKVRGVDTIYSNDEDVRKFAEREGMTAKAIWDLPDPPPEQEDLFGLED